MARSRPKRRSPLLMEMNHVRSVRMSDRPQLRAHLDAALEGVPEDERMRIARTATLSAPEALRLLDEAERAHEALDGKGAARARDVIERFAFTPH